MDLKLILNNPLSGAVVGALIAFLTQYFLQGRQRKWAREDQERQRKWELEDQKRRRKEEQLKNFGQQVYQAVVSIQQMHELREDWEVIIEMAKQLQLPLASDDVQKQLSFLDEQWWEVLEQQSKVFAQLRARLGVFADRELNRLFEEWSLALGPLREARKAGPAQLAEKLMQFTARGWELQKRVEELIDSLYDQVATETNRKPPQLT